MSFYHVAHAILGILLIVLGLVGFWVARRLGEKP